MKMNNTKPIEAHKYMFSIQKIKLAKDIGTILREKTILIQ